MRVLIACEESQRVCVEFRKKGHEAYSCDIEDPSGDHPEWHLKTDVLSILNDNWDMVIAFPPCTHLACSGAAWFKKKREDGRQQQGIDFFLEFTRCTAEKVCIENPVGIMSSHYRKPDQIIQPWMFGFPATKATCLWLKNLPLLTPTNIVEPNKPVEYGNGRRMDAWFYSTNRLPHSERGKVRSKTFEGIAKAMADQWG